MLLLGGALVLLELMHSSNTFHIAPNLIWYFQLKQNSTHYSTPFSTRFCATFIILIYCSISIYFIFMSLYTKIIY